MPPAAYVDRAQDYTRLLVGREAARSGQPVRDARHSVARRLGVAPGTLENLYRGRLKDIAAHLYARLHAGVIAELEAELRHVENDLKTARAAGLDLGAGGPLSLVATQARLAKALGRKPSDDGEPA